MKNLEYGIVLQYLQNSQFPEAQKTFYSEVKEKGGLDLPQFIKQAQNLPTVDAARQLTVLEQIVEGIRDQSLEKDEILRQNAQITADLIGMKRDLQRAEQAEQRTFELQSQLSEAKSSLEQQQLSKDALSQELAAQKSVAQESQYQIKKLENAMAELKEVNLNFQEKDRNYQILSKDLQLKLEDKANQLVALQQKNSAYAASIQQMKQAIVERDRYIEEISAQANQNVDNMKKYESGSQRQISELEAQTRELAAEKDRLMADLANARRQEVHFEEQICEYKEDLSSERNLTVQIPEHLDRITALEQSLRQFEADNAELQRQAEALRNQEQQWKGKLETADEELYMQKNTNSELEAEKLKISLSLQQAQAALSAAREESAATRELQARLERAEQSAALSQREMDGAREQIRELQKAEEEYIQARNQLENLKTESQTEINYLEAKSLELEGELSQLRRSSQEAQIRAAQALDEQIQANRQLDERVTEELSKNGRLEAEAARSADYIEEYRTRAEKAELQIAENARLQARIGALEREIELCGQEKESLQARIEEAAQDEEKLQAQNLQARIGEERAVSEAQNLEARLEDMQAQFRGQEQLIQTIQQSIAPPLQSASVSMLSPSVASQDGREEYAARLKEAKEQISELKDRLAQMRVLEVKHQSLVQQVEQLSGAREEAVHLKQQLTEYERTNQRLSEEVKSQMGQIQQYEDSAKLETELQGRADENLTQLREEFNLSIAQFKQDSEENLIQMQSQREYIQELSRQVQDLKAQNDFLNEMVARKEDSEPEVELDTKVPAAKTVEPLENSVVAVVQTATKISKKVNTTSSETEQLAQQIEVLQEQLAAAELEADTAQEELSTAKESYERTLADANTRALDAEKQLIEVQHQNITQFSAEEAEDDSEKQLLADYEQQIDLQIQCLEEKEQEIQNFITKYCEATEALPEEIRGETGAFFELEAVLTHIVHIFQQCLSDMHEGMCSEAISLTLAKVDEILSESQIFEAERLKGLEILQQFIKSDEIQQKTLADELDKANQRIDLIQKELSKKENDLQAAKLKIQQHEQLREQYREIQNRLLTYEENERAYQEVLEQEAEQTEKINADIQVINDENALIAAEKKQIDVLQEHVEKIEADMQQKMREAEANALIARNGVEEQMQELRMQNTRLLDQLSSAKRDMLESRGEAHAKMQAIDIQKAEFDKCIAEQAELIRNKEAELVELEDKIQSLESALEEAVDKLAKNQEQIQMIEEHEHSAELEWQHTNAEMNTSVLQAEESEAIAAQTAELMKTRVQEMQRQLEATEDEKEELKQQMRENAIEFERVVEEILLQRNGGSSVRDTRTDI